MGLFWSPLLWMASGSCKGNKKKKKTRGHHHHHPLTAIGLLVDTPGKTTRHYSHHPCPFSQPANPWPGLPYLGAGVRLDYRNYGNYTICLLPKKTAKDGSVMLGYLTGPVHVHAWSSESHCISSLVAFVHLLLEKNRENGNWDSYMSPIK